MGALLEIKNLTAASKGMAQANDAEQQRGASACASVHSAEMTHMQQAEFESKHELRLDSVRTVVSRIQPF